MPRNISKPVRFILHGAKRRRQIAYKKFGQMWWLYNHYREVEE